MKSIAFAAAAKWLSSGRREGHMKNQFLTALVLALGLGIAQAQSTSSPAPDSSGSAPSSAQQSSTSDQTNAPQSFKGCLTRSSGGWTLAADNGQAIKLNGTDDQLSSYNNQQVNVQGTQAQDGSVAVSSIDKVSGCSRRIRGLTCSRSRRAATHISGLAASRARWKLLRRRLRRRWL